MRSHHLAYGLAVLVSVLPLWVTGHLPFVDLPQHLYLISVRQRLDDPSTLYPRFFEARGAVTPYEGYYAAVGALTRIARLDLANRIVISGYVVAMPLAMAFLLRSLGRPAWPSLFALPLAYGDSLAWGFLNYCTAIPLALVSCGLVPRIVKDPRLRALWAVLLAVSLLATFAFHVQALAFAGLALLVLLVTTRVVNERGFLGGRTLVLVSALPTLALVGLWLAQRITRVPEVAFGACSRARTLATSRSWTTPPTCRASWPTCCVMVLIATGSTPRASAPWPRSPLASSRPAAAPSKDSPGSSAAACCCWPPSR